MGPAINETKWQQRIQTEKFKNLQIQFFFEKSENFKVIKSIGYQT